MVKYPTGPAPPEPFSKTRLKSGEEIRLFMRPGEGINAPPFEAEELLDLTFPMGAGTGMMYGIIFQLGKWGYEVVKASTFIEVSPVFTEYYQKTLEEKRKLEAQIKEGFVSLTNAVTDFELLAHDARKYEEYLRYFTRIEKAKKEVGKVKGKKKEEAEQELRRANHVLRAMFVDLVDGNAPEGISMRSIAPRWPTIISDFIDMMEEEEDPEKIAERLKTSKAEAVVLATKNKLYREWKDLFSSTIKGRYERLLGLMKARERSIKEYRDALKPLISRYKVFVEFRKEGTASAGLDKRAYIMPGTQAISVDAVTIWAWRPFVVPEVFRMPREQYTRLKFREAGFKDEEIKQIKEKMKGTIDVPILPAIPIVDEPLRAIIKQIEEEYTVKITGDIIYEQVQALSEKYRPPERKLGPEVGSALQAGIRWPYSPYFVFVQMDVERTVIKTPDGATIEDIWIQPLQTWNCTQNIILGRMLELWAKEQQAGREVALLLGEQAEVVEEGKDTKFLSIEDLTKEQFPEIYEGEKKEEKKPAAGFKEFQKSFDDFKKRTQDFGKAITDFFSKLGIQTTFFYSAPYEKLMYERMSKMMQLGPGRAHLTIAEYMKKAAGVPGAEVKVWI